MRVIGLVERREKENKRNWLKLQAESGHDLVIFIDNQAAMDIAAFVKEQRDDYRLSLSLDE